MASNDPAAPAATASPRRARGRGLLWLIVLAVLALGGWKAYAWWQARNPAPAAALAGSASNPATDAAEPVGDPLAAINALRREQHELAQRMSDATSSQQVLRDEVLGVGERAALLEQSVQRIASPRAQGEQALRLDEAELLLTIGQQQIELSSDVGGALHAYELADGTLTGSSDPSVLNLRQSLAQEVAAMRALPPDPRATLAGRIDAFESTLDASPFAGSAPAQPARSSVLDRVVGSMVEVHRSQAQDLLDPASREAALTAARLELTLARLALERRDASAFRGSLARVERWLPRLYAPETVAHQRELLADLQRAPLRIDLPILGGTLAELRRLRQEQPAPAAAANAVALPAAPAGPAAPASARVASPADARHP
ncbi:MAG TPA: uroporphyrinogen-III C-methyltransferase [Xanthomonadaceae bacterium]|jgi:uroporphyrin-3 C-methyltransferase